MGKEVRWCQMAFLQDTDATRFFSCAREADHLGNCDSPQAQAVRKAWFEQKWMPEVSEQQEEGVV